MARSVTDERVAWGLSDLATAYGVSVGLLRKLIRDGALPAKKIGRRTVILDQDLREYLTRAAATKGRAEVV